MAACRLADAGGDGPQPEDLAEGLERAAGRSRRTSSSCSTSPSSASTTTVRAELLEIVRTASADRQLVLLTEDAEVLGWAIELPVEEATAVPADALLTRLRRSNHGLNPTAPRPMPPRRPLPSLGRRHRRLRSTDVDITTPTTIDTDQEAAPTARRWAGQR